MLLCLYKTNLSKYYFNKYIAAQERDDDLRIFKSFDSAFPGFIDSFDRSIWNSVVKKSVWLT
jgi:hypothetical protein